MKFWMQFIHRDEEHVPMPHRGVLRHSTRCGNGKGDAARHAPVTRWIAFGIAARGEDTKCCHGRHENARRCRDRGHCRNRAVDQIECEVLSAFQTTLDSLPMRI